MVADTTNAQRPETSMDKVVFSNVEKFLLYENRILYDGNIGGSRFLYGWIGHRYGHKILKLLEPRLWLLFIRVPSLVCKTHHQNF